MDDMIERVDASKVLEVEQVGLGLVRYKVCCWSVGRDPGGEEV